jgi:transposase-like protein
MGDDLVCHELLRLTLLWLCVIVYGVGRPRHMAADQAHGHPATRARRRSPVPRPFPGLTTKPPCGACERGAGDPPPGAPPPRLHAPEGRPRVVATRDQGCPEPTCRDEGWRGRGDRRANGHPGGGPWRQWSCGACGASFLETPGTPWQGKRVPPAVSGRVRAWWAAGRGIRAAARVFEVDPTTVLAWLLEAADHLEAFSQALLHDVQVSQLQLGELSAVLHAVQAGQMTAAGAIERLECASHRVWSAMDPVGKLLWAIAGGERTLAMAQRLVHQGVQRLAPGCVPLCRRDGVKGCASALLTHVGPWVQPPRRRAMGPTPQPRWRPLPELRYAQVVQPSRRRRLVRVRHRVIFATLAGVTHVLAWRGWHLNTAFMERANLTSRQHGAAVGRRVSARCKSQEGLRPQLSLSQTSHNVCVPHASRRVPRAQAPPTNGRGSARRWQPRTPAMAAGRTDHRWRLRARLLFRVPRWPPPAGV